MSKMGEDLAQGLVFNVNKVQTMQSDLHSGPKGDLLAHFQSARDDLVGLVKLVESVFVRGDYSGLSVPSGRAGRSGCFRTVQLVRSGQFGLTGGVRKVELGWSGRARSVKSVRPSCLGHVGRRVRPGRIGRVGRVGPSGRIL